ncbi:hypothetical protein SAMN02983003_3142 [Devosia enhydra]|uniref:Uncharacterized protein n=1 Tax=Devosia enhydra TaxID=665118 RepID=A0A1K2I0Q7_9HYPH|nr:hypothetical protein [Devosia enhydra]SFZ85970.1 hypothetical protein SAMN02983003_3142 [Devosia enhydra]
MTDNLRSEAQTLRRITTLLSCCFHQVRQGQRSLSRRDVELFDKGLVWVIQSQDRIIAGLENQIAETTQQLAADRARVDEMMADAERTLQMALDAAESVATHNGVMGALADAQAAGEPCDLIDDMSGLRVIYDPTLDRRPFRPGHLSEGVYQPDPPTEFLEDMAVPTPAPIGERWPSNVFHLAARRPRAHARQADVGPGGAA